MYSSDTAQILRNLMTLLVLITISVEGNFTKLITIIFIFRSMVYVTLAIAITCFIGCGIWTTLKKRIRHNTEPTIPVCLYTISQTWLCYQLQSIDPYTYY